MKGLPLWLWFCFEEIEKLTKTRMLPSARYVSSTRGKMMAKPTATPTCEQKLLVFPQHGSHCERLWYLNLNKKFIVNRHGVQVSHSFTVFQSISLVTSQNSRENHFNNVYMMYCSMRWHARCCITDGLMIMGLSSPPGSLAAQRRAFRPGFRSKTGRLSPPAGPDVTCVFIFVLVFVFLGPRGPLVEP